MGSEIAALGGRGRGAVIRGNDLGRVRVIDRLPGVGRVVVPSDLARVVVPLLLVPRDGGRIDLFGVVVGGGEFRGIAARMLGVCDSSGAGGPGAHAGLVPLGRGGDFLRVGVDGLGAHARVKELSPVDGHVVEFAGSPADGAHEIGDDQGGRGAIVGVGGQSPRERVGDHRVQPRQVGITLDDAQHGGGHVPLAEGRASGRARQERRAPGPPVGFLGGVATLKELGRGVSGRAGDEAGARQVLVLHGHRDAEVDKDGPARRTDDVGGLDVAVDDVGVMNGRDRRGQVVGHGGDTAQRDRAGREDLREGGPIHVFGDDEGLARLRLRVDDVGNEGGTHRVHGAGLSLEAGARFLGGRHRGVHGFEGDARAAPVFGEPHRARAARSEPADEPVAAQFLAFFHATRVAAPSLICVRPRGQPRPREGKRGEHHTRSFPSRSTIRHGLYMHGRPW